MFKYFGVDLDYFTRNTQQLLDSTYQTILVKTGFQSDNDSTSTDYSGQPSQTTTQQQQPHPLSSVKRQLPKPTGVGASGGFGASFSRGGGDGVGGGGGRSGLSNHYYKSSSPSPEMLTGGAGGRGGGGERRGTRGGGGDSSDSPSNTYR